MSIVKFKYWVAVAVLSSLVGSFASAADKPDASGKDMAIDKKFSKEADDDGKAGKDDEGKKSEKRSTMGGQHDAATQGLLAQLLVMQSGLSDYLPVNPTDFECFEILLQNGISPENGWDSDKVVTRGDLGRVIVQALGMADEVKNPSDPRSWLDVLASLDIQISTIGSAVVHVDPLTTRNHGNAFLASASLLDEGLENIDIASVLRDVYPAVTRRPVTPD